MALLRRFGQQNCMWGPIQECVCAEKNERGKQDRKSLVALKMAEGQLSEEQCSWEIQGVNWVSNSTEC